jgi:hypothetical protein
MKMSLTFFFLLLLTTNIYGQVIDDGTHTFQIAFAEGGGAIFEYTCTVIIKGDSITVLEDGTAGSKGKIIGKGILMKHKSGKWIIATTIDDANVDDIGGCTDGPTVIEPKKKILWMC